VLLYTLVLAVIFGLVLENYLQISLDNAHNLKAERNYLTAQVLASLARQKKAKRIETDKGLVSVDRTGKVTVLLTDGSRYDF
jgi:hypothetical protein